MMCSTWTYFNQYGPWACLVPWLVRRGEMLKECKGLTTKKGSGNAGAANGSRAAHQSTKGTAEEHPSTSPLLPSPADLLLAAAPPCAALPISALRCAAPCCDALLLLWGLPSNRSLVLLYFFLQAKWRQAGAGGCERVEKGRAGVASPGTAALRPFCPEVGSSGQAAPCKKCMPSPAVRCPCPGGARLTAQHRA